MIKVIARAFRWQKMLGPGNYANIVELARSEMINSTYIGGLVRLALLVPDIVEAIMAGRQPSHLTTRVLMEPFTLD